MKPGRIISLTTDFGSKDWFVGTMKAVILGINPDAVVVDLSHELPPGDIRAGAFALAASYRFFAKGTVHVVVVDPGVGGSRRAIVVQTEGYFFVGPNNGLLSWALRDETIQSIHALENRKYSLESISQTFHGRDIFAPAAAHLTRGTPIDRLGPRLKEFTTMAWPRPRRARGSLEGEVVYVDRFGNGITNVDSTALAQVAKGSVRVIVADKWICPLVRYYAAAPPNAAAAVVGSSGFLEIAINGGSAATQFGLRVGDPVSVVPVQKT
ncbi:MAG TPA: SAM-dependent chlorinase/fluorinase [Candidatus Limnocylindrales bacterium]|jgi:S-adenosylmethionine hydrolase|nr:SAM-dependent chlorinase/fluorinase [Candidatus Limnocylindrales bacterium]